MDRSHSDIHALPYVMVQNINKKISLLLLSALNLN